MVYALQQARRRGLQRRVTRGARRTVVELVPARGLRLYPVGRLDIDSSGLLLLTNDGELANRLTHPRFEVPKTYRARLGGPPLANDALRALRTGVRLDDGLTAPARVRRVGSASANVIELTIHEGRNRQVRRMCQAVGHPVRALERIRFGPLRLNGLAPGASRRLSDAEVVGLRALASVRCSRACAGSGYALTQSPAMRLFALRGAITVERNDAQDILDATSR